MVGERRHPLLAQTPITTPAAHTPSHAHRQHVVGVPSAGVPGVGVRLMQEPGFAAHDSHLYARGRDLLPGRPQEVQLPGRRQQQHQQEDVRRQRALSPGSQHSAAATFFARASQLAGPGGTPSTCSSPVRQEERERRRRRRRNSGERDGSGRRSKGMGREERLSLPTDYRGALAKFSPPIPHALLKKIGTKDVQGLGKVRVVLRVSPAVRVGDGEDEVVTLDKRRRQVTLVEPQARQAQESRLGVAAPKMFAFDQVYTQDDPQSEVVSGAVVDVLHAVLAGNDGCVLCFGGAALGKTYTMLGSHTGPDELGVVPSAVAWLYRAIVEQKAKSGARFSVRVSAVAVDSPGVMLTDLLAEYAQEGEASPGALLRDTTGGYLSSVAELRAPSPEAAAHYLDVAIAARSALAPQHLQTSQQQAQHTSGSATLLYTLHIYQYAVDKSGKGGVVGGRSRLHMIDVGDLSGSGGGMSLSSLTSVLLAIFNGQRYLPNRENKLTMLLKEALGSVTCHAAMVVHVSPASRHVQHTLATLQLASRVHRMRRKKLRGLGGSGSGGSSEGSHGKSSGETSAGSSSMDFSSSEQSCDTVIYIGGGGPGDTDNEHPPVFMPHHTNQQVWPIARLRSMEHLRPHSASPTPAYTRRAASASPTPTSRSVPNAHHPQLIKPLPPPRTVSTANNSAGKIALAGGFIRHQPGVSHIAYNNNNPSQQPLLSSFKPQVALGPLVPGDLRHFNYNAYEEPNNLVPMFQQSRLQVSAQIHNQRQLELQQQQQQQQQASQQQQQQALQHQKMPKQQQMQKVQQMQQQQQQQQQQFKLQQQLQQSQNVQQLAQHQQYQQFQQLHQQNKKLIQVQQFQQHVQQQQQQSQQQQHPQQQLQQQQQQQLHQQQQQQQQLPQMQQQMRHPPPKGVIDGVVSDEQWIDGPRVHKSRVTGAQKIKTNKAETWVDGPQMTPIGYGFMDDHKKTMIERWVAVQTAQVVQQLGQQQTIPAAQVPAQTPATQQQFTHLTQFRTCEESTLDSDQDTLSEDPPSGPGRPPGSDKNLPPQPNLIEELERKNLIPAETTNEKKQKPCSPQSETEAVPKESLLDEKSTGPHCSPDEASGADEPSIDDICSQCEALAEECEELSSLLSCEEEECKRQAHQGLATVLEEPELEADMVAEEQERETTQNEEEVQGQGEARESMEEIQTLTKRGWVRRSLASSGTHHSTELIEVQVPDHPAITMDCCVQVCEEDILRALSDTPCQSEVMSLETSDDHPLRVLSEENLTCASTFTDSYSQIGETGDEDDSDDDDSRPFSLFEVTDYGRVCQDLSLALRSDVANRNLHELAKIHDLYRTLARQSPRVHAGGPRLQAATLTEILNNSHDSLLEEKKPLEEDSICSEPAQADGKLCRQCHKRQLRHGDSILRLESALRSKSQWLSRPLDSMEDSASDKCIGTEDFDFPEDHCTCDVQSDLVPYIPSTFFNFSPVHNPDSLSHVNLTHKASETSLRVMDDAPLADSTEKLADRVPVNGVPVPEFIEDVEANVVLCNPVQYDYSKDGDMIDGNDERTVTGKSDNDSDCVSNISEDSEYMMQTSKLSKFLCVGVGKSKSKTPYKVAKQNNNKIIENKKNTAKLKECRVKIPTKSRENSKSPDRNSKNSIKSPSRVVSQSAPKQNVNKRSDTTTASLSVRTRWGKSARVGASKPQAIATRGNYRYTCTTLMYPPDAATPTEGYDSGHDSGAATQGSATPLECSGSESWRSGQGLPPHHHHHHHHHPAANNGSLGTNPSLGESSGYESIPRDSECSSFSSSQDSEMDDEHRKEAQAHSSGGHAQPRSQAKTTQHPGGPAKVQVEDWSEEDVKRYEGRTSAVEVSQLRAYRQQVLSLKSEQQALKADLAQAKGSLNVPSGSWSYERKSNYT